MVFENVKLPDFVIADLYTNSLIEDDRKAIKNTNVAVETNAITNSSIAEPANSLTSIKYLGKNEKNVSIIVNDTEAVYLVEDTLTLLTNLLTACKLTLADVAIINTYNQSITYKQIKQNLQPKQLLLMGNVLKNISLPFIFPEYRVQQYDNCEMLICSDLKKLLPQTDLVKAEKRKLWENLKTLFKI